LKRDKLLAEFADAKKKLGAETDAHRLQASTEIRGLQKKVQDEVSKISGKVSQIKAALEKQEAEYTGRMDAMKAEELKLQESINNLRTQMNNLKKMAVGIDG